MQMTRRQFGQRSVAVLATGSIGLTAGLEGCTGSQIMNEINVILKQAAAVLAVAQPGAPWLASLQSAIGALMGAEQTWQAGGAVQYVIDALDAIMAVTAVIPITAPFSPLIDILVAGIEAVLGALPPSTKPPIMLATKVGNPHVNKVTLHRHFGHSAASDFKAQWNAVCAKDPLLEPAILR